MLNLSAERNEWDNVQGRSQASLIESCQDPANSPRPEIAGGPVHAAEKPLSSLAWFRAGAWLDSFSAGHPVPASSQPIARLGSQGERTDRLKRGQARGLFPNEDAVDSTA